MKEWSATVKEIFWELKYLVIRHSLCSFLSGIDRSSLWNKGMWIFIAHAQKLYPWFIALPVGWFWKPWGCKELYTAEQLSKKHLRQEEASVCGPPVWKQEL